MPLDGELAGRATTTPSVSSSVSSSAATPTEREHRGDLGDEGRVEHRVGADVDRHADAAARGAASRVQAVRPAAGRVRRQRAHEPGGLGERDELVRADRARAPGASSGRAPRRRSRAPVTASTLGWKATPMAPVATRLAQRGDDGEPALALDLVRRLPQHRAAVGVPGAVHGGLGPAQQRRGVAAVLGRAGRRRRTAGCGCRPGRSARCPRPARAGPRPNISGVAAGARRRGTATAKRPPPMRPRSAPG